MDKAETEARISELQAKLDQIVRTTDQQVEMARLQAIYRCAKEAGAIEGKIELLRESLNPVPHPHLVAVPPPSGAEPENTAPTRA